MKALHEDAGRCSFGTKVRMVGRGLHGCGGGAQMGEQEALESCVWSPQRVLALEGIRAKQVRPIPMTITSFTSCPVLFQERCGQN